MDGVEAVEGDDAAWMPGQKDPLGKWCKYQRDLMRKNMKGQKTNLSEGRIKMLDDLQFPWGSDVTPQKQSTTTLESNNSNVVSPQEVEDASRFIEKLVGNNTTSPLKDSSPPDDSFGLKDLLSNCELDQYLDKFKEAGIFSADELRSRLKDVSFMEKLVDSTGMRASEAIRLTLRASSM